MRDLWVIINQNRTRTIMWILGIINNSRFIIKNIDCCLVNTSNVWCWDINVKLGFASINIHLSALDIRNFRRAAVNIFILLYTNLQRCYNIQHFIADSGLCTILRYYNVMHMSAPIINFLINVVTRRHGC